MIDSLYNKAEQTLLSLRAVGHTVALAESCTGGLVAATLTQIPGASDVIRGGFVVYSIAAKIKMLGIDPSLIAAHGAVSKQTAEAMAIGTLAHTDANTSIAITGVAGPDTSEGKKIGLVYIGKAILLGTEIKASVQEYHFTGNRNEIRMQATIAALDLLQQL